MRGLLSRRAVGLALAVGTLAVSGFAAPAAARPGHYVEIWFYDSSSFTNHVGTRYTDCIPPFFSTEGQVTPYARIYMEGPCER